MTYANFIYYAIGFVFSDGGPVFYSYVGMNGESVPYARDGKFVLAMDPAVLAKEVAGKVATDKSSGAGDRKPGEGGAALFDIPSVLHMILYEDFDPDADIVDALNMLGEYVDASPFEYPAGFVEPVNAFCDFLALSKFYGSYFADRAEDRTAIADTVLWSVGAILANAEIVE